MIVFGEVDELYADINRRIDHNMKAQERLGRQISEFAATHGYESPELDAQFQKLVDNMDVLLEKRHEISDRMSQQYA